MPGPVGGTPAVLPAVPAARAGPAASPASAVGRVEAVTPMVRHCSKRAAASSALGQVLVRVVHQAAAQEGGRPGPHVHRRIAGGGDRAVLQQAPGPVARVHTVLGGARDRDRADAGPGIGPDHQATALGVRDGEVLDPCLTALVEEDAGRSRSLDPAAHQQGAGARRDLDAGPGGPQHLAVGQQRPVPAVQTDAGLRVGDDEPAQYGVGVLDVHSRHPGSFDTRVLGGEVGRPLDTHGVLSAVPDGAGAQFGADVAGNVQCRVGRGGDLALGEPYGAPVRGVHAVGPGPGHRAATHP